MAKILLIETATEVCSAAIAIDGQVRALAEDTDQPKHVARLTLLIQECCQKADLALSDLDAVAVSRGPGSYTSLRVGVSTAKGICYALDKPLIAVDTLLALAEASLWEYEMRNTDFGLQDEAKQATFSPDDLVDKNAQSGIRNSQSVLAIPMVDARRQEVWTGVYDGLLNELVPALPLVLEHNLFYDYLQLIPDFRSDCVYIISGNGAKKMEDAGIVENMVFSPIEKCSANYLNKAAERIFQLADFQDISYFEPFYMKAPNITTPNKPLF